MRLRRLDLEYFGHFTGKSLDFGEKPDDGADFHILFGPNEAGKTTVMEGYLRLLYGFRPKLEPYAFKHDRSALRVSADLDIGAAVARYTRVSGRTGTLRDANDTPLPETALAGALAGLGEADYRKLLSLNDETLESGGEEIARSEGEIGRLLFSAAAGISDLSPALEAAQKEADALYKKGGSKSEFAIRKKRLDEVARQIRETDVSAAQYRKLASDATVAADAADASQTARQAASERVKTHEAIADGLPLLAEITAAETELAPLANHPDHLDIDSDALATLLNRLTELRTTLQGHRREADSTAAELDALQRAPDLAGRAAAMTDLKALRDRCATAATDLPRRQEELRRVTEDMLGALREIGIDGGDAPGPHVPDRSVLSALDRHVKAVTSATAARDTAETEARDAEQLHTTAAAQEARAREALASLPDLQALFDRFGAERVVERHTTARERLRQAETLAETALAALRLGGCRFDALPGIPISAAEGAVTAAALDKQQTEVDGLRQRLSEAKAQEAQQAQRLKALQSTTGALGDAEAHAARTHRDALWQAHLADLTATSAAAFEAAMQADDRLTAARQAQATQLADLRAAQTRLAEAQEDKARHATALDGALATLARLRATFGQHLGAAGVPPDTSPSAFADWLRRAEEARDATARLSAEQITSRADLDAADQLRAALRDALGTQNAPLDALMDQARRAIRDRDGLQSALRSASDGARTARAIATQRRAEAQSAASALAEAQATRDMAAGAALGTALAVDLADALPVLRDLRELDATRIEVQRRIDGMTRDADSFDARLPSVSCQPVDGAAVAAYDALAAQVAQAETAETRWATLQEKRAALQADEQTLTDKIALVEARLADIAQAFAPTIPTSTSEDLRRAVAAAHKANDLRHALARRVDALCRRLSVASRAEAERLLEGHTPAAIAAALEDARAAQTEAQDRHDAAVAARTTAALARDAVTGTDDVAALTAERQTLELELEALMRRHLELQLGHRLAETALRRYRDTHRSGMMQTAEAAFRDLTNGAYQGLTTLDTGKAEVLVAIQASDGAAKPADTLSKGTRFQLYLALRAAAYDQMVATGTVLPFFCDDVFETFDDTRTRAACQLMRRIGCSGQAIYLTHHHHVVEIARQTCGDGVRIHHI